MSTKRKTSTGTRYQRWTSAQLASFAKKWQKKYVSLAKKTAKTVTGGMTPTQQRTVIQRELKWVAKWLRSKTIAQIDAKLAVLKTQIAKRMCCAVTSSKVTSMAIKRLIAKRRQISNCTKIATLVTICSGIKWSSYKNAVRAGYVTSKSKMTKKTKKVTKSVTTKYVAAKYKKQTSTLKKEIQKLKTRNSFMRSQVAKFRKEVTQLQRHYGTLTNKTPRGNVVSLKKVDQDVSNIVRFSNALGNALLKKQQRKAG
jgi:hypothetical protein